MFLANRSGVRAVVFCALLACARTSPEQAAISTLYAPPDARDLHSPVGSNTDAELPEPLKLDPLDDPMALHHENVPEILSLFSLREFSQKERAVIKPDLFLNRVFEPGSPFHSNQGNKAIAGHTISKRACLAGLHSLVLQTDAQKVQCHGFPNMVPVYRKGDPSQAHYCIDIFEFPNEPCELPIVWVPPTHAATLCQLQGKRLCTQGEWTLACRGDPAGNEDRMYAYGNELDLAICNTNKPHRLVGRTPCNPLALLPAWNTCSTDTEPSGAYPGCRSRFGVFDMHGNVAEIMTRLDPDGIVYSQLKGSAWFYLEVQRAPNTWPKPGDIRETYPDHCGYDPRWHIEPMTSAWHVNYHLGFRCCASIL